MKHPIYDYERRLQRALATLQKSGISEADKKLVLGFNEDAASSGLTTARVVKYTYYMLKLASWLGSDLESAGKDDIKRLVTRIEQSDYVPYSKSELKMVLRKFYKWLRQTEGFPPEVAWIRPQQKKKSKVKIPEELLREDEIMALVGAAKTERDRALIAVLYESGCRIGELLLLKLKHISFDEYGAQIVVDGKTGPRRVRLISSVPFLQAWMNKHPDATNSSSYVWVKSSGRLMAYGSVAALLRRTGSKAGIRKKIYPHLFRHSRATYLANHLTEAQMKEVFGWVQESEMASIYVHLSGRDVDEALLRVNGMTKPETPKESVLKPRLCERCQEQNVCTNRFCSRCGFVLDENERIKIVMHEKDRKSADDILDDMLTDPRFRQIFLEKLKSMRS